MMTIKTFEDESLSYSRVKKWAAEFRRGRESMADYQSGSPKGATTEEEFVQSDHV